MDFKKLIPDFSVIAKTNWAKPNLDTKNKMWLVMAAAVLLMVVFAFIPWQVTTGTEEGAKSASTLGVATWYGIIGLLAAVVALYGVLYNQVKFVFCGAVLAAVLGLIGVLTTTGCALDGTTYTAKEVVDFVKDKSLKVSHTGAILFLVASLAAAAVSFLQIKNEK